MKKLNLDEMSRMSGGIGPCAGSARPAGVARIGAGICILFLVYGGWCNATLATQTVMKCDNGDGTGFLHLLR